LKTKQANNKIMATTQIYAQKTPSTLTVEQQKLVEQWGVLGIKYNIVEHLFFSKKITYSTFIILKYGNDTMSAGSDLFEHRTLKRLKKGQILTFDDFSKKARALLIKKFKGLEATAMKFRISEIKLTNGWR
jgi:hypothetical protein